MTFRPKKWGDQAQRILLPSNSAFVMGWKTNRVFLHAINRDICPPRERFESDGLGVRVSLTLRTIATFRRRSDGLIRGQGAPQPPSLCMTAMDEQAVALTKAFGKDNAESIDFDWHAAYGTGFQYY